MKTIEGRVSAKGVRLGIVAARFNELVVEGLMKSALEAWKGAGGDDKDVVIVRCPGAFELPQATRALLATQSCDVIVTLGAVIRGGTPHFEYVSDAATRGIGELALSAAVPIVFGLLTTNDVEQAIARLDKGRDVTLAALEMLSVFAQLKREDGR